MPSIYERLKATLPEAIFYPAATEKQIARVEQALDTCFPDWLRELYLRCNGIKSPGFGDAYLLSLEKDDDVPHGLLDLNQFHRNLWLEHLPDLKANRPEVPWDRFDPRQLLIIGGHNTVEWAVNPLSGRQIIWYDVRNWDSWEVIASDLVEACIKNEEQEHDIEEHLLRGREIYRDPQVIRPANRDIDKLFDILVTIHLYGGMHLDRDATSQRPGEIGELFILRLGVEDELRMTSRDGNFPFVMRLNVWPFESEPTCIALCLKQAVIRILNVVDLIMLPYVDGNRPRPDKVKILRVWNDDGLLDPELLQIANILCACDDKRRQEDNSLGE